MSCSGTLQKATFLAVRWAGNGAHWTRRSEVPDVKLVPRCGSRGDTCHDVRNGQDSTRNLGTLHGQMAGIGASRRQSTAAKKEARANFMIYGLAAGLLVLIAGLFVLLTNSKSAQTVDLRNTGNDPVGPVPSPLHQKQWIHGSADCKSNTDPAIDVFRVDQTSFVLRQNKCVSYEAPFMYLLSGKDKTVLLDTGATKGAADFPLHETVQSLLAEIGEAEKRELVVVHSHHHTDHFSGDSQFAGQQSVTLVEPSGAAMRGFFAFEHWPNSEAHLDLGDRRLTIIPTPGHQEDAISLYDPQTKWLLVGDTIYPGLVRVKNWDEYTKSVARLAEFVQTHEVSAVLGAHIEMTNTSGKTYPIGTTYQPDEAPLVLAAEDIAALHAALQQLDGPSEILFDRFIVAPMGVVQKAVSAVVSRFMR